VPLSQFVLGGDKLTSSDLVVWQPASTVLKGGSDIKIVPAQDVDRKIVTNGRTPVEARVIRLAPRFFRQLDADSDRPWRRNTSVFAHSRPPPKQTRKARESLSG
jgi:hypothetical protein